MSPVHKDPVPASGLLSAIPVASLIVVIVAIAGAVVVCVNPQTLDFASYVKYVGIAAGLLGIGRGLDQVHRP